MSGNTMLFSVEGVTKSNRVLHTPSSFARKNLLYVQEVGELQSLQPHTCRREKLNSFLVMLVLSGKGSVKTNGQDYGLSSGDCAFINCMNLYEHISSEDEPWELMWVHFAGGNAEAYWNLFADRNGGNPTFQAKDVGEIKKCINDILSLGDQKDLVSELNAALLITRLLTMCVSDVTNEMHLGEVREFINKHYSEADLLEILCSRYQKEEKELNDIFVQYFGIELRDYILVRRFTAAKELLRFTIKDVSVIVEESGIRNADLLRQMFRENEGMTAEEYRMKWAQWIKA